MLAYVLKFVRFLHGHALIHQTNKDVCHFYRSCKTVPNHMDLAIILSTFANAFACGKDKHLDLALSVFANQTEGLYYCHFSVVCLLVK